MKRIAAGLIALTLFGCAGSSGTTNSNPSPQRPGSTATVGDWVRYWDGPWRQWCLRGDTYPSSYCHNKADEMVAYNVSGG